MWFGQGLRGMVVRLLQVGQARRLRGTWIARVVACGVVVAQVSVGKVEGCVCGL